MGSLPNPHADQITKDRAVLKALDDLADRGLYLDSGGAKMLESMMGQLDEGRPLSDRQKAWAKDQRERLLDS